MESQGAQARAPFHSGELRMQLAAGKQAQVADFGRRMIRRYLTEQHRQFFSELPFVVLGSVDEEGWPWVSVICGAPGFAHSPDPVTLSIAARCCSLDPAVARLRPGMPLGLLGIALDTRRRNRLNGRIRQADKVGLTVTVDQSFGNCPRYIQSRRVELADRRGQSLQLVAEPAERLDERALALIAKSDTMFVASAVPVADDPVSQGVDVSHRGGKPGFVKVDGERLTVPEFAGNNLYNTLGNFVVNPRAGLLFVDFDQGDGLLLSGEVALLDRSDPEIAGFDGAERGWRFLPRRRLWLRGLWPYRAQLDSFSPHTLSTGQWARCESES